MIRLFRWLRCRLLGHRWRCAVRHRQSRFEFCPRCRSTRVVDALSCLLIGATLIGFAQLAVWL